MKTGTTKKQRQEAQSGCDFYHAPYCVSTPCFCLNELRSKIKAQKVNTQKTN